jgi:hypothetical protein
MRGRALSAGVLLAIACAITPAAAARGSHAFKRLEPGDLRVPTVTDGSRYAAYQRRGGKTRVIDTRFGVAYDARPPTRSCELTALHSGVLLWQCYHGQGPNLPVLLDVKSRKRLAVRGVDGFVADVEDRADGAPYNIESYEVGRQWVGGSLGFFYGYHDEVYGTFYLNWHTGERRYDEPNDPKKIANPDRPGLVQELCAPLHRVRDFAYDDPIYEPFAYAPPYGARGRGLTRLLLERCGHSPRQIDRCEAFNGCNDSFQLGAGLVTWTDYRTAYVYDIERRRRQRFSMRAFRAAGPEESGDSVLSVSHTRNTIFVSVPILGSDRHGNIEARWRLYSRHLEPSLVRQ